MVRKDCIKEAVLQVGGSACKCVNNDEMYLTFSLRHGDNTFYHQVINGIKPSNNDLDLVMVTKYNSDNEVYIPTGQITIEELRNIINEGGDVDGLVVDSIDTTAKTINLKMYNPNPSNDGNRGTDLTVRSSFPIGVDTNNIAGLTPSPMPLAERFKYDEYGANIYAGENRECNIFNIHGDILWTIKGGNTTYPPEY